MVRGRVVALLVAVLVACAGVAVLPLVGTGAAPGRDVPIGTPSAGQAVRVSSSYSSGDKVFNGLLTQDGDVETGWISDPTQPPQGQWIALDLLPGAQVGGLRLTNYITAMRYSRPQTTTVTFTDGSAAAVLVWKDTSQDQTLSFPQPHSGGLQLMVDAVWGGAQNTQPVGVAEFGIVAVPVPTAAPSPTGAVQLPTAPAVSGPTTTAPTTVALPAPAAAGGGDTWRWWLVGALALVSAAFAVRGWMRGRRQ